MFLFWYNLLIFCLSLIVMYNSTLNLSKLKPFLTLVKIKIIIARVHNNNNNNNNQWTWTCAARHKVVVKYLLFIIINYKHYIHIKIEISSHIPHTNEKKKLYLLSVFQCHYPPKKKSTKNYFNCVHLWWRQQRWELARVSSLFMFG